jgi:adenylyltransferase/sulfurtransferase
MRDRRNEGFGEDPNHEEARKVEEGLNEETPHRGTGRSGVDLSDRYSRQLLFAPVGPEGQARLAAARILVAGCGGLGTVSASLLGRAGVGFLRIVDRDVVEPSNLPRQALFDDEDAASGTPKAVAAARRLARINPGLAVDPVVADLDTGNVLRLLDGIDLVVDGFDNFAARYLLNDACVSLGIPWIYGACVGSSGVASLLVPGHTPCLRCLQPEAPATGSAPTCDTAGVIGPITHSIASLEVALALRHLCERESPRAATLVSLDVWSLRFQRVEVPREAGGEPCRCCDLRRFDFLEAPARETTIFCGRDTVQVMPPSPGSPPFEELARRLASVGEVRSSEQVLRLRVPPHELTLFADGRALVRGTDDPAVARGLVARFFGM